MEFDEQPISNNGVPVTTVQGTGVAHIGEQSHCPVCGENRAMMACR